METILIDEKEMTKRFVEKACEINKLLVGSLEAKMIEYGLNPYNYVGGLSGTISSNDLTLEENINNLFAVFTSNYAESIFFQCESIKQMNTLNLVKDYLRMKGLEDEFLKFRDANRTTQKRIG
ncbi:hypothetical protein ACRASQ_15040 [Bacteroides hominis]|uniref:hypothetical protein n=1 Tax=Bacteroides TaxID=816 RepID=UPI00044793BE|nr:hypothetical protein [Bacteroides fragilis]EXY65577.1 hypothetical protein M085_1956 [Bacteroides fragilis str. 3986 N(B)19]EYA48507.1 hypothetical protein M115_2160 [Bacteroides fragilis str. 3719 T6]